MKPKRKTRRERDQFPALNRNCNLPSRWDYIEADYIDGVKDANGNIVIRALTTKEKNLLNKFYEETVITNFSHNPKIKALLRRKKTIVEDDTVKALIDQCRNLKAEIKPNYKRIKEVKELIHITKKQNEEIYFEELLTIEEELYELREEHLLYPNVEDHKQFYNDNNGRNNCIYNIKKTGRNLTYLDVDDYDKYLSVNYTGLDGEHQFIYDIERTKVEAEEERLVEVDKVERQLKKLKKLTNADGNTDNSSD